MSSTARPSSRPFPPAPSRTSGPAVATPGSSATSRRCSKPARHSRTDLPRRGPVRAGPPPFRPPAALSGLKHRLERPMAKVFEIYIRTTPERLWEAITDGEIRSKYNFGARVTSDWTPGSRYEMSAWDGTVALGEGENLEVDPPRRLVPGPAAL